MGADLRESARLLREPFPKSSIGKLPKGGAMLDYVGHAAVTDRLLAVDPEWSWEPLAFDEQGLPRYDAKGGLWIRLTICGVSRLGYGDGPDPKQRIGDAIRNAAMRFGVALDLWAKEDLVEFQHVDWLRQQAANDSTGAAAASPAPAAPVVIPEETRPEVVRSTHADPGPWATDSGAAGAGEGPAVPEQDPAGPQHDPAGMEGLWASPRQMKAINAKAREVGANSTDDRNDLLSHILGRPVTSLRQLTMTEASALLDRLKWLEKDPALAEDMWAEIGRGQAVSS